MVLETRFKDVLIQLHPSDTLAVARRDLPAGTEIRMPDGSLLRTLTEVSAGHKLALRRIPSGETVLRYGHNIGLAQAEILPGEHIHTHNLAPGVVGGERGWRVVPSVPPVPTGRTFMGYPRPDGRAGTRNYVAVISTVNCSAHTTARIARAFPPERLADYPNVDGVIAVVHPGGCSIPQGGLSQAYLRRSLLNLARHPNIAAAVYVGLGCEVNQIDDCSPAFTPQDFEELPGSESGGSLGKSSSQTPGSRLVIQELGGFDGTLRAGIAAVERYLPLANANRRIPLPLSSLCLGLECGGSDSWSGVTANPLVGLVSDILVREGGTAVLSETPEIFGAERSLLDRVASDEVGQKLLERFNWWVKQAERHGFEIDSNPTPGNKRGGLTTILEKSLGAAVKGGSTTLQAVYEYAEWIESRGFVFMDTPGNDPISMTGMLAGGCNISFFTTGRGTPVGTNLAPTIKIASNSRIAAGLADIIDFDAGRLLEGLGWDEASQELLDLLVETASGRPTQAEKHGLPESEFVPWQPDQVL